MFWSQLPSHCQTWVQAKLAFYFLLFVFKQTHILSLSRQLEFFLLCLLVFLSLIFKPNSKLLQVWHKIHSYVCDLPTVVYLFFCVFGSLLFLLTNKPPNYSKYGITDTSPPLNSFALFILFTSFACKNKPPNDYKNGIIYMSSPLKFSNFVSFGFLLSLANKPPNYSKKWTYLYSIIIP